MSDRVASRRFGVTVGAAVTVTMLVSGCDAPTHSIRILNQTGGTIEDVNLIVGGNRTTFGGIATGISKTLIFSGRLPPTVAVEWATGQQRLHQAVVELSTVRHDFAGTIVVTIASNQEAKLSLLPPIPLPGEPVRR